jgi:membrane-bound metal-dependent hydrolase YbcI (DUF457 family)
MPPTGFHGILGLLLCFRIDRKHKNFRIGLVWGLVIPDLDLLGSALIFLLTLNTDLTLAFHRSLTHSLITIICILGMAFLLQFKWPKARTTYFPLVLGIISGMILHISLDMFYWDGVSILWPLQPFGERITIITFTYKDLSPLYNSLSSKLIAIVDGHFELLFFLFLSYLANKYNTNQQLFIRWRSKQFTLNDWPKKLRLISFYLVLQMIFFLLLAFLSISWLFLDRDTFIIILYIPLLPVFLLSGLIPIIMQETIAHINIETNRK